MNKLLVTLSLLVRHIVLNVSNYALLVGTGCILYFIYHSYGVPTLILSIGVFLVGTSIVLEISKKNTKKTKKYY